MIPDPWIAVVLVLASFRLARLAGWDDFPPVQRLRDRLTGAQRRVDGSWQYKHPTLAAGLLCSFCAGFWIALAVYLAWLASPTVVLYALAPFALSAAVGLIARNLDP